MTGDILVVMAQEGYALLLIGSWTPLILPSPSSVQTPKGLPMGFKS